jgi:hypothetical protein
MYCEHVRWLHCTPRYRRLSYYLFALLVTQPVIIPIVIPILSAQLPNKLPTGVAEWSGYESKLRT